MTPAPTPPAAVHVADGANYADTCDVLGRVTGHTSDEDGPPDVGLSLGLSDGRILWTGEISDRAHEEAGDDAAALATPYGWWVILYEKKSHQVIGRCINEEAGQALILGLASALRAPSAPCDAAVREALDVGLNVLVACVKPAGGCDDERDIAHAISVMQAALALPTPGAGGWQEISTAPRDGTEVLLFRDGRQAVGAWKADPTDGGLSWETARFVIGDQPIAVTFDRATHWQPLRAVPGAGGWSQAVADVLAERQRQVSVEGWTPEHDDGHRDGELACAAGAYALNAGGYAASKMSDDGKTWVPRGWPWQASWWKPTTPRRDLVKAVALGLAEIERLDRQAAAPGATP